MVALHFCGFVKFMLYFWLLFRVSEILPQSVPLPLLSYTHTHKHTHTHTHNFPSLITPTEQSHNLDNIRSSTTFFLFFFSEDNTPFPELSILLLPSGLIALGQLLLSCHPGTSLHSYSGKSLCLSPVLEPLFFLNLTLSLFLVNPLVFTRVNLFVHQTLSGLSFLFGINRSHFSYLGWRMFG